MSLNGYSPDSGDATLNASFDQFELDFMYKFGNISARADVNATPSFSSPGAPQPAPGTATSSTVYLEQGFVSYANAGGFGISAGRFLSSSGFEAAEPTGMFQYSYSKTLVYGYYQNGLNLSYTTPMFGLYGAVVSDLWNPQEFDVMKSPGFEGQVTLTPVAGVTAKAAYLFQMYDTTGTGGDDESQSLLNVWAQYAAGPITAAGEFNLLMNWGPGDFDGIGFLVMGNYKFTDKVAATLRYSAISIDDKNSATDDYDSEITVSPSYAISPNWLVLAEGKYELLPKKFDYAVESTFSF
ncbi:MAG: porin [Fibrobacteres bacterium]|nr:porin [Fibrobacterota bacterium]